MLLSDCITRFLAIPNICSDEEGLVPLFRKSFSCTNGAFPLKQLYLASDQSAAAILALPTELIGMVAMFLCDADLCRLTRVSRYMAVVISPIYFRRHGLVMSPRGHSLSTRSENLKALGMWRRSLCISPVLRLHCSFSFGFSRQVTLDIHHSQEFFAPLPLQRTPFSHHVYLNYLETPKLQNSLDLLRDTVSMTRCQGVTMTALAFEDGRIGWKKKTVEGAIILRGLQELNFIHCQLSPSQWINFLEGFVTPSLQVLEFTGEMCIAAVYDFLARHCDIHSLHFEKCTSNNMPTFPCPLTLPKLRSLQGTLSQTLHLLRTLLSPPPLQILVIEHDQAANVRHDMFVDDVMDCLEKCNGLHVLEIRHSKEDDIAGLTVLAAHTSAARRLRTATLSCISELSIGFEDDVRDEVLRAYCEAWMTLLPNLQHVSVGKTEKGHMLWGQVYCTEDAMYELVWNTKSI